MSKMSNLQVELYSAEKYLMGGVANNITLSGMFIACDPHLVKMGGVIEIKYQLNSNGFLHKYSMVVLVKEALSDGVMVVFHKFDNNTFSCVRDFILQPTADLTNDVGAHSLSLAMRNTENIEQPIKYRNANY